jgi:hypothetical protein
MVTNADAMAVALWALHSNEHSVYCTHYSLSPYNYYNKCAVHVPPHQKQYEIFTYPKTKRPTTINQKVLNNPPRANIICPTTSSVAHIIVPRRIPKTLQEIKTKYIFNFC